MKSIQTTGYAALLAGGMLALAACSNDDATAAWNAESTPVPLEVEVAGIHTSTRGIVEGTTLPEGAQYGIFATFGGGFEELIDGGGNVLVNYAGGTSTISQDIPLPEGVDVGVYAYYPYGESYNHAGYLIDMPIEADSQTDYMWGRAVNAAGYPFASQYNPKVSLVFHHAMARVTLKIKKAADNETSYKFPYVSLLNVCQMATMNIYDSSTSGPMGTTNLTVEPAGYVLAASTDEIIADFLVIPAVEENVTLNLNDTRNLESGFSASMPKSTWHAGMQYTYEVTIGKGGNLSIGETIIAEWQNNVQESLEVNDGNYAGIEIGGTVAEAVDLGLSVKWASWNIGASAPEETGNLVGWADPTGAKSSWSNDFYPSTNPPANICGTEYDIASVQWGSGWRLPSKDEMEELLAQCTWTWTARDGVSGYLVEGANGNSIFLPITGERIGITVLNNARGSYWTGTCRPEGWANSLSFNEASKTSAIDSRYMGQAVRPVTE